MLIEETFTKEFNDFEYALIQYCGTSTFERINIGVILKDGDRTEFKMIDSFSQITHAYDFKNPDELDFPLDNFRRFAHQTDIFKNGFQLCNCIEVFVPDIPFLATKDDFETALEDLWQSDVKIICSHRKTMGRK